jgi:hypothetical protein
MTGAMRGGVHPFASPIWRQRQFVPFWLGESISMIGSSVSGFALPLVAVITLDVTPDHRGARFGISGTIL